MKLYLYNLYEYNYWADKAILKVFIDHQIQLNTRVLGLFSHVVNAQVIWYSRILKKAIALSAWKEHSLNDLISLIEDNSKHIKFIIDNYNLEEKIEYKTSLGVEYVNSIEEILFHLINHGTHHKGQINTELKSLGIIPPSIDYIAYKRG